MNKKTRLPAPASIRAFKWLTFIFLMAGIYACSSGIIGLGKTRPKEKELATAQAFPEEKRDPAPAHPEGSRAETKPAAPADTAGTVTNRKEKLAQLKKHVEKGKEAVSAFAREKRSQLKRDVKEAYRNGRAAADEGDGEGTTKAVVIMLSGVICLVMYYVFAVGAIQSGTNCVGGCLLLVLLILGISLIIAGIVILILHLAGYE